MGRFSAAPRRCAGKLPHVQGHPFSRSYGVILPSSLAVVISHTLGCSPRVPVSVCGTVTHKLHRRLFSSQGPSRSRRPCGLSACRYPSEGNYAPSYVPDRHNQSPSGLPSGVPAASTLKGGAGILTCCPSPTPFGLGLGPTNPGRTSLAQETLPLRWEGFSPSLSLLMPAFSLLQADTHPHGYACSYRTLPYRAARRQHPKLRYMT